MPKFLSWNVIMSVGDIFYRPELIANTINCLDPDYIFLQESSSELLVFLEDDYVLINQSKGRKGYLMTFHRKGLPTPRIINVGGTHIGIIIDEETYFNVHLDPLESIAIIKRLLKYGSVVGDTNIKNNFKFEDLNFAGEKILDVGINVGNTWFGSYFSTHSKLSERYDRLLTKVPHDNFTVHIEKMGQSDHLPITFTRNCIE